jgi:SAM-dependent methyltransferase
VTGPAVRDVGLGEATGQTLAVGDVDYDRAATDYERTRGRRSGTEAWRGPVLRELDGAPPGPVVDLGSGTGSWSAVLSGWTGRAVVAVEPSAGMRAEAAARTAAVGGGDGTTVLAVAGRGGALPLRDRAAGAAWLSTVIHHVGDIGACARELRRALAPGAPVVLRGAFAGRYDGIGLVRYFPGSRRRLDRFPSVEAVRAAFEGSGFAFARLERVDEPPIDLREWREALPHQRRADTALVELSDEEFAAGLRAVDAAIAAGEAPGPVGLDLLAFR